MTIFLHFFFFEQQFFNQKENVHYVKMYGLLLKYYYYFLNSFDVCCWYFIVLNTRLAFYWKSISLISAKASGSGLHELLFLPRPQPREHHSWHRKAEGRRKRSICLQRRQTQGKKKSISPTLYEQLFLQQYSVSKIFKNEL